ncbi:hypothetical protein [Stutzerimonas zhaodongensis]|uniref:hypothetical protein n=1 Tax=Stutzerimonas zhaodongensis TaxID=1176257 RepID=UPI00210593B1|nr:hypothetical protein [Stutzerimonas zhaodongensis]MCQ2031225.1 hypothetical protein [Stutzerimonas zhaodongensis]
MDNFIVMFFHIAGGVRDAIHRIFRREKDRGVVLAEQFPVHIFLSVMSAKSHYE